MTAIAVNVLWFLIGLIILAGVVYLAIWVVNNFIYQIPPKVEQGVWVIILLLALIFLILTLTGSGPVLHPFRLSMAGQCPVAS